jgi:hypothetical protein
VDVNLVLSPVLKKLQEVVELNKTYSVKYQFHLSHFPLTHVRCATNIATSPVGEVKSSSEEVKKQPITTTLVRLLPYKKPANTHSTVRNHQPHL